ncbi:sensor histidine kinase [Polaribacter cellanae]|uniref:Histidine kinase n=1 Tax=Polaribacter cellanae TaxID=2818493 RepID=A0A975CSP3_9FLAO|nr:sensor histidine kinase [Polaribacter cellanae]QTE23262.1 histidine kinase [Polaribacter cellanae]
MTPISRSQFKLVVQLIFWTLFLLLFILLEYVLNDELRENNIKVNTISRFVFDAIIFYFHYKYLSRLLLSQKKYLLYIASITVILFLAILEEMLFYSIYLKGGTYNISLSSRLFVEFMTTCVLIISSGAMYFSSEWVDAKHKEEILEKNNLKLEGELKFLKGQITPHFLFNILNSIYSLSYKNSPKAALMVDNLSKIMRYLIYEGAKNRVYLSKEIKLIQDYIRLYGTRFTTDNNIDFYHENILPHHKIAPMLLISFVENAIKHSDIYNNKNAWVKLEFILEDNTLFFTAKNSKPTNKNRILSNNIGNQNVIKQLQYIYPNAHSIEIKDNINDYNLKLTINL